MYLKIGLLLLASVSISNQQQAPLSVVGTWRLISGTTITKTDTAVTDYTKDQKMIKIINKTHFSFLRHDLKHGKDASPVFEAGGGTYSLKGNQYTEFLEYCNAREWEGKSFQFTVTISKDTLIQRGIEKVEAANINREIIEKYLRVK